MPMKSVRDGDMVDLRGESCCGDLMRRWVQGSSPAFHRGSTSRHRKSLCLGVSPFCKSLLDSRSSMSDTLFHDRERVHPQNQTPRAETRCASGLCPCTCAMEQ